jgi:hypothetical protein
MSLATRFWGSAASLLCFLLIQSCQSNSLSATAEEEPAASPSSSGLAVRQRASSESLIVPSVFSVASAAHDASACLKILPSNKGEEFSNRCLDLSASSSLAVVSSPLEDSKPPAKRRCINMALGHSHKEVRDGKGQGYGRGALDVLLSIAGAEPGKAALLLEVVLAAARDKAFRQQALEALFLEVLLVAAQDKYCRQQALEALGNVAKASPDMFFECLPCLRAAANAGDNDVRLLALKSLGEVEWKHYFGEVGPAPDLPRDMATILDSACPFWPGQQVKDTHLLVLIPAKVNGKPFTLNLLGELIKSSKGGGSETQYSYYTSDVQSQVGNEAPASSYWVLITRDVLPESRKKTHAAQKKLVSAHASCTGLYEMPKAMEAATTILTHYVCAGERLYGNVSWTCTRCQELIRCGSSNYPVVVGSFEPSGFYVGCSYYDDYSDGAAGCRKFLAEENPNEAISRTSNPLAPSMHTDTAVGIQVNLEELSVAHDEVPPGDGVARMPSFSSDSRDTLDDFSHTIDFSDDFSEYKSGEASTEEGALKPSAKRSFSQASIDQLLAQEALQSKVDLSHRQLKSTLLQPVPTTMLRSGTVIPLMVFGAQAWNQYYGEVGEEPALPADMEVTLDASCPFWPGKQVKDTHLLVLIPAQVDGKPFTLDLLVELIKSPKGGGNETQCRYYDSAVQSQVGNETQASSYWVLLTRDVLPGSRCKGYGAQKELVSAHASRTGLHYKMPKALEAATAILTHHVRTGERLYGDDPRTYTRCQELIHYSFGDYPSVVGGFEPSGLDVYVDYGHDYCCDHDCSGIAGFRKFF